MWALALYVLGKINNEVIKFAEKKIFFYIHESLLGKKFKFMNFTWLNMRLRA